AMHTALVQHYPNIVAFLYFDTQNANGLGNEWWLQSSPEAYQAWIDMARDPRHRQYGDAAAGPARPAAGPARPAAGPARPAAGPARPAAGAAGHHAAVRSRRPDRGRAPGLLDARVRLEGLPVRRGQGLRRRPGGGGGRRPRADPVRSGVLGPVGRRPGHAVR